MGTSASLSPAGTTTCCGTLTQVVSADASATAVARRTGQLSRTVPCASEPEYTFSAGSSRTSSRGRQLEAPRVAAFAGAARPEMTIANTAMAASTATLRVTVRFTPLLLFRTRELDALSDRGAGTSQRAGGTHQTGIAQLTSPTAQDHKYETHPPPHKLDTVWGWLGPLEAFLSMGGAVWQWHGAEST